VPFLRAGRRRFRRRTSCLLANVCCRTTLLKTAEHPVEERLHRVIGPWGLALTAVNIAIGAGIFILPGILAGMLGPAAVLAHLVCGVATALVMTCFVELSSEVTRTGGPLAALEDILGPWPGFLCWLLYGLYGLAACGFLSLALSDALGLQGVSRLAASTGVVLFIGTINAVGVRYGFRFAVATTIAKLVPLALVILGGAFVMRRENLHIPAWPTSSALGTAAVTMFFAFSGTEAAMLPAGELRDPRTTVPRGIFMAVLSLTIIYASVQWVSQGVLGGSLHGAAPLADVAAAAWGPVGRTIVRIGTAISVLGSLSGALLAFPRWAFLGARMGVLPANLGRVNVRFETPFNAIIATTAATVLVALSGALQILAALTSASILGVYFAACLAVLCRKPDRDGFHLPGAKAIAVAGAVTTVWLLAHLSTREYAAVFVILIAGVLYRLTLSRRPNS
jgi:APA family basic amino acid/polyamine antiporter